MKKFVYIFVLLLIMMLAACSSDEKVSKDGENAAEKSGEKVEVDKGLFGVEVTLPASFFEGEDIDTVIANAKGEGVDEVIKNADGSLTYKMSKSKHKEMMEEMRESFVQGVDEMVSGGDFVSIKDITYNDDFSKFTMMVDKAAYESSFDGFATFGLGMTGMMYQVYGGVESSKAKVVIQVKDESTGEVFGEIVYPDDMEEGASATEEEKVDDKGVGSRSNPVPFLETITVEDELYDDNFDAYPIKFDLTVLEVIRGEEAYQRLLKMNQFNEEAPEGYEWVLAKTKVYFKESATEDESFFIDGIMNFKLVSENGDIYSGNIYGTTDPDFSFEMYVGNEKEGYIAGLVKVGENAQLRYERFLGGKVFFNLQ